MPLNFTPPLLNSANAWATTKEDLENLYDCPYTGAITTRTCTIHGFDHDDSKHQFCFLDPQSYEISHHSGYSTRQHATRKVSPTRSDQPTTSLNTYGYSPIPFPQYVEILTSILKTRSDRPVKPIIFSITGTPNEITQCYNALSRRKHELQRSHAITARFLLEINLSCPNIAGEPPPAYSKDVIERYLRTLTAHTNGIPKQQRIETGIKTPPFTYKTQFDDFVAGLLSSTVNPNTRTPNSTQGECPITFLTATNTLGSCLFPSPSSTSFSSSTTHLPPLSPLSLPPSLPPTPSPLAGLAGPSLHPLSLGNVFTLRTLLSQHPSLQHIEIIGVGGVSDRAGYERMRKVGASAVGVGTALGVEGVGFFEGIWRGKGGSRL